MNKQENVKELQEVFADWVFPISEAFARELLKFDEGLEKEGEHWGFRDTVVREQAMDAMARLLLNIPWPLNTNSHETRFTSFTSKLPEAYDAWEAKRTH